MRERGKESGPSLQPGGGMLLACGKVAAGGTHQEAAVTMLMMIAVSAATAHFATSLERKGRCEALSCELKLLLLLLLLPAEKRP